MPNKEYIRDHQYEEQTWLTVVKYLWLHLNTSWGLVFCTDTYLCTVSKFSDIHQEKKIHLPNREYISGHRWERINMVTKCIVHVHITVEHKVYWPFCLLTACFITPTLIHFGKFSFLADWVHRPMPMQLEDVICFGIITYVIIWGQYFW